MHWIALGVAILLEVSGTICMKLSEGLTRFLPSVLIFVFYGLSFASLTLALGRISVSTAYAIWAGMGTALVTLVGTTAFNEGLSVVKVGCILMIIAAVVGLHLVEAGH
jgi:small multidrug resistance pump